MDNVAQKVQSRAIERWKVAAAAVAIDLCIGSVYAWSVYKTPLRTMHGWSDIQVSATFSIAIMILGLSAAFGGQWMERQGPRASTLLAAICYGVGILGAGVAAYIGSLWLLYATYGVIGGVGLGLGYVPPVSTLLKWFPDRRGLATGMAVFGFGAGALITAPIASRLIPHVGVAETFWLLGSVYLIVMLVASRGLRLPPADYRPVGWDPAKAKTRGADVRPLELNEALATPQFWLLWGMFFLNITAGIMLIGHASPMAQEVVGLTPKQAGVIVGLMGIFNGAGRILWSVASDFVGRVATFAVMFVLQIALFFAFPHARSQVLFQTCLFIILTCYGGGFAMCPAFIADMFGTRRAGAIYGVVLTAWGAGGIAGPALAAILHERTHTYALPMYCIAGAMILALLFTATIALILRRETARATESREAQLAGVG